MRSHRSAPGCGPKSPASKKRDGAISYPFSLHALDEAIASAERMSGGGVRGAAAERGVLVRAKADQGEPGLRHGPTSLSMRITGSVSPSGIGTSRRSFSSNPSAL